MNGARISWWTARYSPTGKWQVTPIRISRRDRHFVFATPLVGRYKGRQITILAEEVFDYPPLRWRGHVLAKGAKKFYAEWVGEHYARKHGVTYLPSRSNTQNDTNFRKRNAS